MARTYEELVENAIEMLDQDADLFCEMVDELDSWNGFADGFRVFNTYDRTTPLSNREIDARARFTAICRAVALRAKDLNKITADQAAFKAQKDLPNGKKTMKSYLWYLEAIAYDEAHEQD